MKQIITPLVFFALSICSAEEQPKGRAYSSAGLGSDYPQPGLVWVDAKTQRAFFTVNDIIVFDWNHQVFELKLNAALDFRAWMVKGQYRDLLVKDNLGTIYRGRWVSPVSSMGFSGPVYHSMGASTVFCICDGYGGAPRPHRSEAEDPRFSNRLYKGLKEAGRLGTIANIKTVGDTKILELPETYDHRRIDSINLGWHDCGKGLRIRVEFFADTFRIFEEARAHLFFFADGKIVSSINDIVLEIKFTANKGQFRSDIRMEGISPSVITDGIYVCRFRPWTPLPGSLDLDRGSGRVSLSVLIRRKTEDRFEIIRRLDFCEIRVPVSGPMPV